MTEILNQTVNPTLSIEDIEHAINEVNQAKNNSEVNKNFIKLSI